MLLPKTLETHQTVCGPKQNTKTAWFQLIQENIIIEGSLWQGSFCYRLIISRNEI